MRFGGTLITSHDKYQIIQKPGLDQTLAYACTYEIVFTLDLLHRAMKFIYKIVRITIGRSVSQHLHEVLI